MDATERAGRVLATLVREYIASGEPVPSSLLVRAAGLGVSSATVRNILARLEADGYVQQPHTSAGRIPTDRGYRFYVDLLLESKRHHRAASVMEARLRHDGVAPLVDSVLSQASHAVSQASRHVGFALRPAHESAVFTRIEFIPIGASRVLVVIVSKGGHVVQKVIDTGTPLAADSLRAAANYLNEEFAGLPLARARDAIRVRLDEERLLYDELLERALRLGSDSFTDLPDEHVLYVDGAASILEDNHDLTLGTMQALLGMIEEKAELVRLLNAYMDGTGLTVVIGAEHLDPSLRPFSLVACTLQDDAGSATIGVIGPTRMRYGRAIAVVDGAAQAISRVLRT